MSFPQYDQKKHQLAVVNNPPWQQVRGDLKGMPTSGRPRWYWLHLPRPRWVHCGQTCPSQG